MKTTTNKTIGKVLSIALCLVLVMSYVPLVSLTALGAEGVSYIDASGETQICTEYTSLTSYQMTSGWYVLDSDITFSGEVYADGDVHLILKDGCTLNAKKGGINVSSGGNLVIYGQSNNTGTIYATGSYNSAGIGDDYNNRSTGYQSITINGGTIIATGYDNGAGIGGANGSSVSGYSGTITVNGGNVTATGGRNAAGIGGGRYLSISVIVNGGNINATGGSGAAGIGGGIRGVCSNTYINGGYITATGGYGAAGIGNGSDIDEGWSAVTVNGGIVFANGGSDASGIGVNDVGFVSVININAGLVIDNNSGTLYSDVTIDRNVTLGSDQTLTIPSGKTLTVGEGKTLTNDGTITNNGTLINNGTFNENNNFVNNGVFTNNGIYNCNHKLVDGICTKCGAYKEPTQNEDGYYEIGNAGQLYWFAEQVNAGNIGYNAILLNDIIVNENVLVNGELNTDADAVASFRQWTAIGKVDTNKYIGTFDGQGYEIKGLYTNTAEKQNMGLFGYLGEGAVVKNLGVVDGYLADTSINSSYPGGDSCYGGGIAMTATKATISKCYNTCTIKTGGDVGGIAGRNYSSRIEYCYNAGNIICTAASNAPWYPAAGGIAGGNYSTATSYEIIYSCYNIGTISSGFYYIGSINGSLTGWSTQNCYYLSATDNGKGGKTAEQFASGEVAYLLQQGNTEQVWGQDSNQAGATPIFDSTGLYKVVTVGETGNYSVANVGDTNGDGTVDVEDYQELVNKALADDHEQIETASYDDIVRYDLDGDGYLDVIDAYLLHLFINGFATVDVYAVGDYDLNGIAFEEADIKAIKHTIENPEKLATYKKYASDINGDGKVDAEDTTLLTDIYGENTGTECADNVNVYYRWGNKYSTCTATAMCTLCGKKVATETVNTTSETLSELTCTQDGTVKYTAIFENELFEEKVKTVTTNMLSHDLGEYADNGNGTHGLACKYCDYVDASTIEKHTYDENDKCVCGAKVAFVSTSDELLAALEQGGEIKLTGNISMPNDPSYEGFSSHVVIHLNGYDITVTQNGSVQYPVLYVVEGGSLTVNGEGTVTHEGGGPSIGCIGGELTVNGGTFNGSVNVDEGGTVTINGGTFNSTVNSIDGGTATINGGTFNNRVTVTKGDTVTINGGTFNYDVDLAERDVTITGGTFNGQIGVVSSTVTITGGTFDFGFDPTDYLAEGYTIVFNETDFTWTVTVAQNN